MFVTSNPVDVVPDIGRKRCREGEDDSSTAYFGEHRNKRIHSLPLRTSSTLADPWQASSFNSDANGPPSQSQFFQQQNAELDMMDSTFHMGDDDHLLPCNEPAGQASMPVYSNSNFAVQARAEHGEWAGPGPVLSNLGGVVNLGHHASGFADDQCVPRAMSHAADWQALRNGGRFPAPISEDDIFQSQVVGTLDMMLDENNNVGMTSTDISLVTQQRSMDHPNATMDIEISPTTKPGDSESEAPLTGSIRRGHVRSKHTIDSWTWQPGMKKSFSIGYRADCEKCQLKVPGHFNHIVIS